MSNEPQTPDQKRWAKYLSRFIEAFTPIGDRFGAANKEQHPKDPPMNYIVLAEIGGTQVVASTINPYDTDGNRHIRKMFVAAIKTFCGDREPDEIYVLDEKGVVKPISKEDKLAIHELYQKHGVKSDE